VQGQQSFGQATIHQSKKGRFFLRIPNLSQDCHREKSLSAAVDLNLKGNPSRLGI
jgi:hypothetical protein